MISITNISSIGEYCINEYGYWAGSHCPCHWGVCTTSTCPVGTMEVYPTHYDQILSCNGTTDCSILTPPRTWRSCYRFPWNNIHVDFIQILGVCVTGTIALPFSCKLVAGSGKISSKHGSHRIRIVPNYSIKSSLLDLFPSPYIMFK